MPTTEELVFGVDSQAAILARKLTEDVKITAVLEAAGSVSTPVVSAGNSTPATPAGFSSELTDSVSLG